jgi:hypothetical protein
LDFLIIWNAKRTMYIKGGEKKRIETKLLEGIKGKNLKRR